MRGREVQVIHERGGIIGNHPHRVFDVRLFTLARATLVEDEDLELIHEIRQQIGKNAPVALRPVDENKRVACPVQFIG